MNDLTISFHSYIVTFYTQLTAKILFLQLEVTKLEQFVAKIYVVSEWSFSLSICVRAAISWF
jgi:hypothetical protein